MTRAEWNEDGHDAKTQKQMQDQRKRLQSSERLCDHTVATAGGGGHRDQSDRFRLWGRMSHWRQICESDTKTDSEHLGGKQTLVQRK